MTVLLRLIIQFLTLCLLFPFAHAAPAVQQVSLQLDWKHQFEFAGFYAAKEKGFYREAGLDVELFEYDGKLDIAKEVVGGRKTFGIKDADIVGNRLQGAPVVLLSNYFKRSPLVIVTKPDIRGPADLKGKRLMGVAKDIDGTSFRMMFKQFGITRADMTIVPHDFSAQAFIDGKVDATTAFLSNELFRIQQAGVPHSIIDPSNFGAKLYGNNLFTAEAYARAHPDTVRAFKQASDRGWAYALEHPEEIIDLILQKYNTQKKSRAALQFEAREIGKIVLPKVYPLGSIDPSPLLRVAEIFIQAGEAKSLDRLDGLVFEGKRPVSVDEPVLKLDLSEQEKAFIKDHPVIRVSNELDWPPYDYFEGNTPKGYSVELMQLLAARIGVKFEFVQAKTWDDLVDLLCARKIDLLHSTDKPQKVLACGSLSPPIIQETSRFLTRMDYKKVNGINDLFGAVAASPKGWEQTEVLKKQYGDKIKIIETSGILEAIEAVRDGRADFTTDLANVLHYHINRLGYTNLQTQGIWNYADKGGNLSSLYIATRKDWPTFHTILGKALAALSTDELQELRQRWLLANNDKADAPVRIALTPEEQAWLKAHPVIRASNETDYPPFDFAVGGQPQGYSVELLNLLAPRIGFKVEYITGPSWDELVQMHRAGTLNLLHSMYRTPAREINGLFTDSYFSTKSVFVSRAGDPDISGFKALHGKTVAVGRGWAQEEFLKTHYPNIKRLPLENLEQMLEAVARGDADALVETDAAVGYWFQKKGIRDLKISGWAKEFNDGQSNTYFFYARKDAPPLVSMLNKAMAALPPDDLRELQTKWFGSPAQATTVVKRAALSADEAAYLKQKGVIRLCGLPDWMPFERINNQGEHEGIAAQMIELLSQRLDVKFVLHPTKDWVESLAALRAHQCDVLPLASDLPSRRDAMNFTKPYIVQPFVIATLAKELFVKDASEIGERSIGVVKGYSFAELLRQRYPNIQIVTVENPKDGLERVRRGEIWGYVDAMPSIGYVLQKHSMLDLKIVGKIEFDLELSVASRKDEPLLASIMQKGVDAISEEERRVIIGKWVAVRVEQAFDYSLLWKLGAAALLLLIGIVVWNRKLAALNKRLATTQDELQRTSGELERIFQNATVGIVFLLDRHLVRINKPFEQMFGWTAEELIGQSTRRFFPSKAASQAVADAYANLPAGQSTFKLDMALLRADGTTILCEVVSGYVDPLDPTTGMILLVSDVTELRQAQAEIERQHQTVARTLKKISTLLNNSGQGFLMFGADLCVDDGYSRECERIFGCDVRQRPLPDLICPDDELQRALVEKTLRRVLASAADALRREAYLGLLPVEYWIAKRCYQAEYRVLADDRMMLILTNVTDEKQLQQKLALERARLEFVVTALENRDDLLEVLQGYATLRQQTLPDLLSFERNPHTLLADVLRQIHTFKSLFAQAGLPTLPAVLHQLETRLVHLRDAVATPGAALDSSDIKRELGAIDLGAVLEPDLDLLREKLGDSYFSSEKEVRVPASKLAQLEVAASNLYGSDSRMLELIRRLRYVALQSLLEPHFRGVEQLAQRQGKLLAPIAYQGDQAPVDPEIFGPFCKALVHLFRNAVDHGIEDADTRLLADKNETASLRCEVHTHADHLTLTIADDGRGIDVARVRAKALEKGLLTDEEAKTLADEQVLPLIFADGITTRDEVGVISGRGVGLSALAQELRKIGGTVRVNAVLGQGTRFEFTLPFQAARTALAQDSVYEAATKLLAPLPAVLSAFCSNDLKLTMTPEAGTKEYTADQLFDFTAIISMGDSLQASLGLSIERPLLLEMTRRFEPNFAPEDIEELADSVGAEIANTLFGNATVYFTHLERRVAMGTPQILRAEERMAQLGPRAFRGFAASADLGQCIVFCILNQEEST